MWCLETIVRMNDKAIELKNQGISSLASFSEVGILIPRTAQQAHKEKTEQKPITSRN